MLRNQGMPGVSEKAEMLFASELVNWYYFLRGGETKTKCRIDLYSSGKILTITQLALALIFSFIIFIFFVSYDYFIACFSAVFILYSIPMLVANYRISRYESLYINGNFLVLNNAIWAITLIEMNTIESIEYTNIGDVSGNSVLNIGRGNRKNVVITLSTPAVYHGVMGQSPRLIDEVRLKIDSEDGLKRLLAIE